MNLKHLTDKILLQDTKFLAIEYRSVTTKILHHLKEIERRRLYSELGYSSLFDYTVKELGFSEPSAGRRINAARLLADIPEIEQKIESGELNLTNISSAAQTFKNEDIKDKERKIEILSQIENSSKKECEKTLREYSTSNKTNLNLLKFHINDKDFQLFQEIKGLLGHVPKDNFWKVIFEAAIKRITADKFKTESTQVNDSKNPRYLPAHIKKAVYLRDKVCKKCGGKWALEYDHILPYSMSGKTEIENIRLLCKSCNQRHRKTQRL